MLLEDNMSINYKAVKFHGNSNFLAVILFDEKYLKYLFAFTKNSSLDFDIDFEQEWAKNQAGQNMWCFTKNTFDLKVLGEKIDGFDFDFTKHLMPIEPHEFDNLCKLLERVYPLE